MRQQRSPHVSVGMPVHNRQKFIATAIEAHLNQTNGDFELVITDNASTDHTEEICRSYAARDSRVRYYRNQRNLGATGNYRRSFELARGEYFRWSPSDDSISPTLHERAIEILDGDPAVMVAYGRTKLIDAAGNVTRDIEDKLHWMQKEPSTRFIGVLSNLSLGNLLYGLARTEQLRKTGLLRNYSGGDYPLIAEMSLYGKIYEIPDAFFYRRMHEEAASALKSADEVMRVYDPERESVFFPREWVHLGAHVLSVARAPIEIGEKIRIYRHLTRRAIWNRQALGSELEGLARRAVGL
jgi:glycosyltransferase involved in cell wall biosynthesis